MLAPPQLVAALLAAVVTEPSFAWRAIDDVALEMSLLQAETKLADSSSPSASFFMVQLADPQFGMMHFQELRWEEERRMLDLAVKHINRLRPDIVVLVGDMQDWWQTNLDRENGKLSDSDAGEQQLQAVKHSLARLRDDVKLMALPGNHDVGNAPTLASLAWYENTWGDLRSFDLKGVRFVPINSQLYYAGPTTQTEQAAPDQTSWLREQLKDAGDRSDILGVVILSHIPPFIGSANETHGWGNWLESYRNEILRITQRARLPASLFVCGHFHGNVEQVYSMRFGARVEVVTSSAVGATMQWNGQSGPYSLELASTIAATPDGGQAFVNYIAKTGGQGSPNFTLASERKLARRDRSGVRVFEFNPTRGYRHQWFTLDMLSLLPRLDEAALRDVSFTPFHARRDP